MKIDLPKKYKFGRYVSSGYHGNIYLVYEEEYKIIKYYIDKELGLKELKILNNLNHPNLLKIKEFFYYNNKLYLVQDYYSKGNLYSRSLKNPISKIEYNKWIYQLNSILEYLHQNNICHNDLKLNNILLNDDDDIILIDFGSALINTKKFESDNKNFIKIKDELFKNIGINSKI